MVHITSSSEEGEGNTVAPRYPVSDNTGHEKGAIKIFTIFPDVFHLFNFISNIIVQIFREHNKFEVYQFYFLIISQSDLLSEAAEKICNRRVMVLGFIFHFFNFSVIEAP